MPDRPFYYDVRYSEPALMPGPDTFPDHYWQVETSVRHPDCHYETTLGRWSCSHREPQDQAALGPCICVHCAGTISDEVMSNISLSSDDLADALTSVWRTAIGTIPSPIATPPGEVSYPHPDCVKPFQMIRCDFCGWENHCGFAPHDDQGPLCPTDGRGDSISWQEPMTNPPSEHYHADGDICPVSNCPDCRCLDCVSGSGEAHD